MSVYVRMLCDSEFPNPAILHLGPPLSPPPPVNIDFELANFSFHLGSCAMRQGFDPKERGLGSVMDVVKPSVPKLGNGQRASRETL